MVAIPWEEAARANRGAGPQCPPRGTLVLAERPALEGTGFSTEHTAGREGEGLGVCHCGVWSTKVHSTTILVEKSVPRAGGMRGRRASASAEGLRAFKTSAQGLSWGKPNRKPCPGLGSTWGMAAAARRVPNGFWLRYQERATAELPLTEPATVRGSSGGIKMCSSFAQAAKNKPQSRFPLPCQRPALPATKQ